MKSPKAAYFYALNILKRRWPEAEPYIMKDPEAAVPYANILITQRKWPEAEPYIIKNPEWASLYAIYVLNHRWKEAEPIMKQNPIYWQNYKNRFNIK
jgi:hypothetical protein